MDYEVGDRVIVDMGLIGREDYESPFPLWDTYEKIAVIVVRETPAGNYRCKWKEGLYKQNINPYYIIRKIQCQTCKSEEVYHDKREEWVCPFCEEL